MCSLRFLAINEKYFGHSGIYTANLNLVGIEFNQKTVKPLQWSQNIHFLRFPVPSLIHNLRRQNVCSHTMLQHPFSIVKADRIQTKS